MNIQSAAPAINYIRANGNKTFAVPSAYATPQAAADAAGSYDYQGTYTATITIADGTYSRSDGLPNLRLPALVNYPYNDKPHVTGNTSTPTNVALANTVTHCVVADAFGSIWYIKGVQAKAPSSYSDFYTTNGGSITFDGVVDLAGAGYLLQSVGGSINWFSGNITVSSAACQKVIWAWAEGYIIDDGSTTTFTHNPIAVSGRVVDVGDQGVVGTGTFVNGGYVSGNNLNIYNMGIYEGNLSDIPGTNAPAFYGINTVGTVTYNAGQLYISNPVSGTEFKFLGGHDTAFLSAGSSGSLFGLTSGQGGLIDYNTGTFPMWWDTSGNLTYAGVAGFTGTTGAYSNGTPDAGLSRLGAASLALGNGTASNKTGNLYLSYVVLTPTTVAGLPAASAGLKGARAFVTDELAAVAFNTIATGGGANNVPVFCDGTNWRIG